MAVLATTVLLLRRSVLEAVFVKAIIVLYGFGMFNLMLRFVMLYDVLCFMDYGLLLFLSYVQFVRRTIRNG